MRAHRLAGGAEPLVEAGLVEALGTGLALEARQLAVGGGHDRVADEALFDPRELTHAIVAPEGHRVRQCAVLVAHERRDRQQPLAQPPLHHAHLQA